MRNIQMLSSLLLGAIWILSGCGSDEAEQKGTAYYVDSAVIGAEVSCGELKSITDASGSFRLVQLEGGSCEISIANILLRVVADVEHGDYIFEDNIEVAQFLQALDNDGDASNGIEITSQVSGYLRGHIDIIPPNDGALQALVIELTNADIGYMGQFITKEEASIHIEKTRQELYGEDDALLTLVADAGGNLRVSTNDNIRLDGRGSYDPNSQIVKYEWYDNKKTNDIKEGKTVVFTNLDEGTHIFTLEVTNLKGQIAKDEVEVIVVMFQNNVPNGCHQQDPLIEAGIIEEGEDVIYTGSMRPGGKIFNYMWQNDGEVGVKEIEFEYSLDNYTNSPHFEYCENLTTGGFADWRLPSASEYHIFLNRNDGYQEEEETMKCTYENSTYQQELEDGFYATLAEQVPYATVSTGNSLSPGSHLEDGIHNGVFLINNGKFIETDSTMYKTKGEKAFVRCVRYVDPAQNIDWNKYDKKVYEIYRGDFDRDAERDLIITNVANESHIMLQDNDEVGSVSKVYGSGSLDVNGIPTDESDSALIYNYCKNLVFAKYTDWRLPTEDELGSIKFYNSKLMNKSDGEYAGPLTPIPLNDFDYPYLEVNGASVIVYSNRSLSVKDDAMLVRCVRTVTDTKPNIPSF